VAHEHKFYVGAAVAALLFALAGCGGDGPKLVPVKGTITINGKTAAAA